MNFLPRHREGEEKAQSPLSKIRAHSSPDIGEGKRKHNLFFQSDGIALEEAAAQASCYADKQQHGQVATRARIVSSPNTGKDFLAANRVCL